MKTVLFVPGFQEDTSSRNYRLVLQTIEAFGDKVEFVPVTWKRRTILNWATELRAVYRKHDPEQTILAGFSFGATITLVIASEVPPAELWLFSLSPYFKETIDMVPKAWLQNIGHRRTATFSELSLEQLCKTVACLVKLFIGKQEIEKWPDMKTTFDTANKYFKNCESVVVPDVGHEVDNPKYIAKIKSS